MSLSAREEIALQLTLKSIEKMGTYMRVDTVSKDNQEFSNQVVSFYNNIYEKLDLNTSTTLHIAYVLLTICSGSLLFVFYCFIFFLTNHSFCLIFLIHLLSNLVFPYSHLFSYVRIYFTFITICDIFLLYKNPKW